MTKRLPGSERTREALNDLMDGRLQIMAGSRQDDVVFDILRQPNVGCWLRVLKNSLEVDFSM